MASCLYWDGLYLLGTKHRKQKNNISYIPPALCLASVYSQKWHRIFLSYHRWIIFVTQLFVNAHAASTYIHSHKHALNSGEGQRKKEVKTLPSNTPVLYKRHVVCSVMASVSVVSAPHLIMAVWMKVTLWHITRFAQRVFFSPSYHGFR